MDISKITPGINRILLKLDKHNDSIKFLEGELKIDISWEIQDHVSITGEVVSVGELKYEPDRGKFGKQDSQTRLEAEVTNVLRPGDFVWVDYLSVLLCLGQKAAKLVQDSFDLYFEQGDDIYVLLPYTAVRLISRRDDLIVPDGLVLCKKIKKNKVESDIIYIPETARQAYEKNLFEVMLQGKPYGRMDYKKGQEGGEYFAPGTIVYVKELGVRPLENPLHAKLDPDYVIAERNFILCTVEQIPV